MKKTAQIGRVVTDEKERRKGLANALMQRGIKFCKKNDMKKNKVYLERQVYCKNLYLKLGFIILDEFLDDGIFSEKTKLKFFNFFE